LEKAAARHDPRGLVGRFSTRFLVAAKVKNMPLHLQPPMNPGEKVPLQSPLQHKKAAKFDKKALLPIPSKK